MNSIALDQPPSTDSIDALIDRARMLSHDVDLSWLGLRGDQWAMASDALRFVAGLEKAVRPRSILEFGAGQSTRLLARTCTAVARGGCRITSIEHDPDFFRSIVRRLADEGLGDTARCIFAPLVARLVADEWHPTYCDLDGELAALPKADLIIVDGPPKPLGGRGGVLYQLHDFSAEGAIVVFDDGSRDDVSNGLRCWEENLGDAVTVRRLEGFKKGLACAQIHRPVPTAELAQHRARLTAGEIERLVPAPHPITLFDAGQIEWPLSLTHRRMRTPDETAATSPADDADAIRLARRCIEAGSKHVAIAWPAFWWLEHFPQFREFLKTQCTSLIRNARLRLFHVS